MQEFALLYQISLWALVSLFATKPQFLTINPCKIDQYVSKVSLQFHISWGSVLEPRSRRCDQSISVPHFTFAFTSFPSFIFYITVQLQTRKLKHTLWACTAAQGPLLSTPAFPALPICIDQQAQKWLEYAWKSSISFLKIAFLLPSFSFLCQIGFTCNLIKPSNGCYLSNIAECL